VESGTLVPAVRLDGYQAAQLMQQLQARGTPLATELWKRVHHTWTCRGIQSEVVVSLSARELQMIRKLGASRRKPGLVNYRYLAIYRNPDFTTEVRVKSYDRPPKRRTFRVVGHGRKKFIRSKLYRARSKESSNSMARKTKKAPVEDELENELEGLEELEDMEDEDVEEPESEVDEDEEEETKPRRRRTTKAAPAKAASKRTRKKVVEEPEDEDEEDEEDDEEEVPAAKKARTKKSTPKAKAEAKEEQAKQAKGKGTGKSKGPRGAAGKTTAEATGGVGTAELAEAASEIAEVDITGRDVRVYLRQNGIAKDEEHGRYVWPSTKNKAFVKLAKAIAAEFEDDE